MHALRAVEPSLDDCRMRKALLSVWAVAFAAAVSYAIWSWVQTGGQGSTWVAVVIAVVIGVPGAINAVMQVADRARRPKVSKGVATVVTGQSETGQFKWTKEALELRAVLSAALWEREDIEDSARVSGMDMSRLPYRSRSGNAWQVAIENAWSSADPEALNKLLSAAADKSPDVAAAVDRYRAATE